MDLTDQAVRDEASRRLAEQYAGRPVIVGPGVLAGFAPYVAWFRDLGCPVLVVATARGAGPVPDDGECTVVEVTPPVTISVTDELRQLDRMARHLPAHAVAAIEEFDPERRGVWFTTPFVTTDEPVLGRPVTGGRPRSFLALEDKMLADAIWAATGVSAAPHRLVPVDRRGLRAATEELAGPLGAVWSGDARDGFNGGGNYVRWVRGETNLDSSFGFFAPRCDRVRVMPFLDGVPCSIHGFVLPGGTAALRPVEIAILRDVERHAFVYGGLGTSWDPPAADRDEMRDVVRRVGAHLQSEHGYRGAFGIDGVLTADGFRPTELNTRMSAGATAVCDVDRRFFTLLQSALVAGFDPGFDAGITPGELEATVALMDARRTGKVTALVEGHALGDLHYSLSWDGRAFSRASPGTDGDTDEITGADAGNVLTAGDTPSGSYVRVDPCTALVPGQRLARVNTALLAHLDREHGTDFGALEPAPDVR